VQDSKGNFVSATGVFDATKANGTASMQFSVNGANAYKSGNAATAKPPNCTVKFDQSSDGKLFGHFLCPEVDHTSLGGKMCSVSTTDGGGTSLSFFQFSDCAGF
jgi:hypothetical protein